MRRKLLNTVFGADDEQVAEAQKQAGLEDSDHRLEAGIELFRVGDFGNWQSMIALPPSVRKSSPLGSGRMLVSAPVFEAAARCASDRRD